MGGGTFLRAFSITMLVLLGCCSNIDQAVSEQTNSNTTRGASEDGDNDEPAPRPQANRPSSSTIAERTLKPDQECGPDQFYWEPRSRCRNCTEISQLFQSYQEWLGREVGDARQPDSSAVVANGGGARNGGANTGANNNLNYKRLSIATSQRANHNHEGQNQFDTNGVLSRLISVDPQDQEYIDSSSNQQNPLLSDEFGTNSFATNPDGSASHLHSSQTNADSDLLFSSEPSSSSSSSSPSSSSSSSSFSTSAHSSSQAAATAAPAQSSDNLIKSTKQTLKFVSKFLRSNLITNELLAAMDQCKQQQNGSSCQMWSNMCVMTMYSYSDIASSSSLALSSHQHRRLSSYDSSSSASSSSSSSMQTQRRQSTPADNNYELIQSSANHNGNPNQAKRKTWQQCRQFNTETICNALRDWFRVEPKNSADIQNIYAIDEPLAKVGSGQTFKLNQAIQLLAYKYSLEGQLLGVDQFGLGDMERFCLISDKNLEPLVLQEKFDNSFIRLGRNANLKCKFDQNQASLFANKHFNETVFIDLYIGYALNGAMFVKPVPILVKNLLYNGAQVNRKHSKDPTRWKLVHRFFFHSTLNLGYKTEQAQGGTSERDFDNQHQQQRVILFAKSVQLEFKFRKQEKGAILSSLLLSIDYGQLVWPIVDGNNMIRAGENSPNLSYERSPNKLPIFESSLSISQTLIDMQSFKKDLDLVMTILSILSSIWSLIKCYNVQKCYGVVKLDLDSLIRFIIIACDTVANLFATVTLLFLAYLFVALKFQSSVQILAPNEELESALIVNLQLAFVFKLIGLAQKLYVQLSADLFFIDWEKPKMLTSSQILNHNSLFRDQSNKMNDNTNANQNEQPNQRTEFNNKFNNFYHQHQQSSFWRPYTVANRWLQIQTMRRQNLTAHLVLFVCLVETTRLTNLATADSNLDLSWPNAFQSASSLSGMNDDSRTSRQIRLAPNISVVFRILILSIVYLALGFGQFFYKKYIYEPMIRNTVSEFVDLCSVANVSLFSMLYPRFGYYIHGRNPNGSGDCGVAEMNALLEREERELCSKRGLAPNSDQQTFVLILPRIINDHYKKLLIRDDLVALVSTNYNGISATNNNQQQQQQQQPLNKQLTTNNNNSSTIANSRFAAAGNNLLRSALNLSSSASLAAPLAAQANRSFNSTNNRTVIEIIVAKNKAINIFLTNFLEHIYKDIDYSIRERRRFESLLLDVDFDDENSAARNGPLTAASALEHHQSSMAATFCKDNSNSFTALLLLGLEADLILVELFALLTLDLWLGQPLVVTASMIWFLHQLFKSIYGSCARHNLVTKSLIDEKFLALK